MLLVFSALSSCAGGGETIQETPIPVQNPAPETPPAVRGNGGGIADEIRKLVEEGTPPSILRALDLIRSRDLGSSEYGRIMNAVSITLIQKIYPDIQTVLPLFDPPQTHVYTRIIREAERGNYTPAPSSSQDYLEYVLPFLAFLNENRPERLMSAVPDLTRAKELNRESVLAPFFLGLIYERSGRMDEAEAEFTRAYEISRECYPAVLGLARVMVARGNLADAIRLLSDLVTRYPDNMTIKRQLAIAYYQNRDWSRAEPAVAEILQRDPRDGQFILMRAHIMVEQGQFLQAQAPLDLYATIDSNNRLYLFLRARVQAEGYRNRDSALNYLRSILRSDPNDEEASVYAARLLMESHRPEDQSEGRAILQRLLGAGNPSPLVMDLALQDAIRREAWQESQGYLDTLLNERRSSQDLLNAYTVNHGLGNNAAALSFARELYERDPSNEDGAIAYISALIDTGRRDEASRMIESRLASLPGGTLKSKYYYLRSRIRTGEESIMNDLRSSLFEDPRNLDALIAMFEIYHRRRDERRAVYYLKQALALAPDNPLLQRYQNEYASALGSTF
ncbi:tetratricopeptide repeat protein [Breznakiella homolactica]|uniref:Tetratricopeptide repeat protein n=1 Tax=Breznakiella homolactica TaxID=2798577 RepID=A0A7T7XS02_9SPIR|nr:tetratricopeptide repeat protein [Breznakiella homolactica]